MSDLIWAMILGPLMWIPGINIIVGILAYGWPGFIVGLIVTILSGGAGSKNETVRKTVKNWWDVLGVSPHASKDEISKAYRSKAKQAHLDHGGSPQDMAALNAARDAALRRGRT